MSDASLRRTQGSKKRIERLDSLVRKASAAASGLLCQSERVLVVYEEGSATLYYEADDSEDGIRRHKLPRAS